MNILKPPNLPSGGQILKIWTNGFWFLVTRQSLVTRSGPTLFYFAIIFVTIQYGLASVAKRPFCEVTFIFFRMRDSKACCVKTDKRFEAFRPLFSPVQQKAKKLPKKNRERTKRTFRHLDESLLNSDLSSRIYSMPLSIEGKSIISFAIRFKFC